jgi:hypothetical protein
MGALNSSNWSSILSALSWVMKLWEAPMSKKHNIFCLKTFLFNKINQLRSLWARRDALPSHGGGTHLRVSQSQIAEN